MLQVVVPATEPAAEKETFDVPGSIPNQLEPPTNKFRAAAPFKVISFSYKFITNVSPVASEP